MCSKLFSWLICRAEVIKSNQPRFDLSGRSRILREVPINFRDSRLGFIGPGSVRCSLEGVQSLETANDSAMTFEIHSGWFSFVSFSGESLHNRKSWNAFLLLITSQPNYSTEDQVLKFQFRIFMQRQQNNVNKNEVFTFWSHKRAVYFALCNFLFHSELFTRWKFDVQCAMIEPYRCRGILWSCSSLDNTLQATELLIDHKFNF